MQSVPAEHTCRASLRSTHAERPYGAHMCSALMRSAHAQRLPPAHTHPLISLLRATQEPPPPRLVAPTVAGRSEHNEIRGGNSSHPLQFYLAADSMEAYQYLTKRFPQRMLVTKRDCTSNRHAAPWRHPPPPTHTPLLTQSDAPWTPTRGEEDALDSNARGGMRSRGTSTH